MPGHALAQLEVHPVGVVDHEPEALGAGALAREQLDLRLVGREALLDLFV